MLQVSSGAFASSATRLNPRPGDPGLCAVSQAELLASSAKAGPQARPPGAWNPEPFDRDYPEEMLEWLKSRNLDARTMINDGFIDPATGQNVIHRCVSDHKKWPMLSVMRHLCNSICNAGVWTALSTGHPLDCQPIHILCQNKASNKKSTAQDSEMLRLLLMQKVDINAKGTLCVHNKWVRRQASEFIRRQASECTCEVYYVIQHVLKCNTVVVQSM